MDMYSGNGAQAALLQRSDKIDTIAIKIISWVSSVKNHQYINILYSTYNCFLAKVGAALSADVLFPTLLTRIFKKTPLNLE